MKATATHTGLLSERQRGVGRWRWPLVVVLLATIPAFYGELLDIEPAHWGDAAYGLAALMLGASLLHRGWQASIRGDNWRWWRVHSFDLLLLLGLTASALGPASSNSPPALLLRLLVAFMTLAHLVLGLRHLVTRGGVVYLLGLAFAVLLACGAGFWWLEPRTPTLADGLWLAFTTAATVGYGDIVPSTPASRIFAVFVVLLGLGVLTLATASLATSWIETEERRIEREILGDLRRQIHTLHAEIAGLRADIQRTRGAADN